MEQTIGGQTLTGIAMPNFQDEIRELVDSWKPYLVERYSADDLEKMIYFKFRNKRGDKVKIYRDLVRAYNKGWFSVSLIDLAKHLAIHSNLAPNKEVELRISTIYHFLKIYKNTFTPAA